MGRALEVSEGIRQRGDFERQTFTDILLLFKVP